MDNLMLLQEAYLRSYIFYNVFCVLAVLIGVRELRIALDARSGRHRSSRKKPPTVRSSVILLVLLSLCAAYHVAYGAWRYHEFTIDRTENTMIAAEGMVTEAGRVSRGKSSHYYRILLETDAGEKLELRIHENLVDDYDVTPGDRWAVTYYPRTKTLCEAERADESSSLRESGARVAGAVSRLRLTEGECASC